MATQLTILLTLRGRSLHTLRWLWHANRTHMPHRVIIADGAVDPVIDRVVSSPRSFPNVDYEYRRYNDRSFSDFYQKCADALEHVQTPYVMMFDNDDFLFPSGIDASIAFLGRNNDYVCAGGNLPEFRLASRPGATNRVIGEISRFMLRYPCGDIAENRASDRVMQKVARINQLVYYHVCRTEALRQTANEIVRHDFSDLEVHERYWALRLVTFGKVHSDSTRLCYLRQIGTSSRFSFSFDWVHHLLRSRLPQDYQTTAGAIAEHVALLEAVDPESFKNRLLDGYADAIRTTLGHTMMRHRFPRLFRIKQRFENIPRPRAPIIIQRNLDRASLLRRIASNGASSQIIALHRAELDTISETLRGTDFIAFLKQHAPELLSGPA